MVVVRWSSGDRLCQTSPIPRSPDGDKNFVYSLEVKTEPCQHRCPIVLVHKSECVHQLVHGHDQASLEAGGVEMDLAIAICWYSRGLRDTGIGGSGCAGVISLKTDGATEEEAVKIVDSW